MMILAIKPPEDFEDPLFGQIKDIYIIDDKVYFYVCVLDTLEYSEHYCASIAHVSSTYSMVPHTQLASYLPLKGHKLNSYPNCFFIVPKFVIS